MPATAAKARFTCTCGAADVSCGRRRNTLTVKVNIEKARKNARIGQTRRRNFATEDKRDFAPFRGHLPISESILMSESILSTAEPASKAARMSAHNLAQTGAADLRMLAQVEKWMAMISRNQPRATEPAGL